LQSYKSLKRKKKQQHQIKATKASTKNCIQILVFSFAYNFVGILFKTFQKVLFSLGLSYDHAESFQNIIAFEIAVLGSYASGLLLNNEVMTPHITG